MIKHTAEFNQEAVRIALTSGLPRDRVASDLGIGKSPLGKWERTDMKVLAHIREQYRLSLGSFGRPRMTMELKEVGLDVGERRVGRLMTINGIKPVRTRKHKATTDSHHRLGVAANWLDGDFAADTPNRKWAGDITYIWTSEGWLYLAVILDLHSRRVVGWPASDRMKKDLAIRALDMAVRLRSAIRSALRALESLRHWWQRLSAAAVGAASQVVHWRRQSHRHGFRTDLKGLTR